MLLDYSKGYFFPSLNDRIGRIVRQAIKQSGVEISFDGTSLNHYLPKEEALKLNYQ